VSFFLGGASIFLVCLVLVFVFPVLFRVSCFLISHDRTFLNNVVGSTVVMEGDGIIEQYAGGYDDYSSSSETLLENAKVPTLQVRRIRTMALSVETLKLRQEK
jgi:ATPase subunit of ABC transporter with duplicated ATPase domains